MNKYILTSTLGALYPNNHPSNITETIICHTENEIHYNDRPRLYTRAKPSRSRLRLSIEGFWLIYDKAEELGFEDLQIAMGLSLLTFMREGDILELKLDEHLEGNLVKKPSISHQPKKVTLKHHAYHGT